MRVRLLFLLVTLLLATSLLSTQQATAFDPDCPTVNKICEDMGDMMYDMCIVSGGDASACTIMAANFSINCKRTNGCPPSNN